MSQTALPSTAPPARLRWRPFDRTPAGACRLARFVAAEMLDVPIGEIDAATRSRQPICLARHVAMYFAHVVFQQSFTAIAAEFGRDRSGIGYAVRRIEDRRDDAAFDTLLIRHEARAAALMAPLRRGAAR
jgi:hypothetical protein